MTQSIPQSLRRLIHPANQMGWYFKQCLFVSVLGYASENGGVVGLDSISKVGDISRVRRGDGDLVGTSSLVRQTSGRIQDLEPNEMTTKSIFVFSAADAVQCHSSPAAESAATIL